MNDFVDFVNGKELRERGGPEFEAQLKLFTNSIERFTEQHDDTDGDSPRQDGTSSSEDNDDPSVAQGSWVLVSNGQSSPPPTAHPPVSTAVDRSPEPGWAGSDVSDTEGTKLAAVEELALPRRANASFPVGSPAPAPQHSPARVAGPAGSAAQYSSQALSMLGQGFGERSFAFRLEHAVWQHGKSYNVIRVPDQTIGSPTMSVQAQAPSPESATDVEMQSVSPGYTSQRVRDREIWGTSPPSAPDAYQNRMNERSHLLAGEHTQSYTHHGGPQFAFAPAWDQGIGVQRQEGIAAFQEQEEFLGPREVAVYLNDRGVHLTYSLRTAAVEIDPNDFRGSFSLFANGKRGPDGRRTPSDGGSDFPRSPSRPAPLEAFHPFAARAAETVHPGAGNTLFTDMTATGSTDTGSYSAYLCPAIPIGAWSPQRPGKAVVDINVDNFIQGLVRPPSNECRGLV